MTRGAAAVLVLVGGLLAAPGARAHPHSLPPPLSFDLQIRDDGVQAFVFVEVPVIEAWRGGARWPRPRSAAARQRALEAFAALLAEHVVVSVDGAVTAPEGVSLELLEAMAIEGLPTPDDVVSVELRYPAARPPRAVGMLWTDFTGALWEKEVQVPSLIETPDDVEAALLSPEEPEHVWHRREPPVDWSDPVESVAVGPRPVRQIPALAIGLGVLALGLLVAGLRRPLPRPLAVGLPLVLGLAAVLARDAGTVEILDVRGAVLPSEARAAAVFTALHRGVYAAFDAESEGAAKARLAARVVPDLVEPLHGTIRERLLLRTRGGVRCRVAEVETLSLEVECPVAWARHFEVLWHGRIHCAARHHGHRHDRFLELGVRFLVRHDGTGWRLADRQELAVEIRDLDSQG